MSHSPSQPFLTNPAAINYIETSKLMVLAASPSDDTFQKISDTYRLNASCITEDEQSKRIGDAQKACADDRHVVAIKVENFEASELTNLEEYSQLALDHNYIVTLMNEPETLLPQYIGWHLNEADSCMLGLCAHALLDDLLKTFPEFCSDFRNFSQSETIAEMLRYYQLASSNHNGMLHCTAKYFGDNPSTSSQEYYKKVKESVTMSFETAVIGLVFTPRTFGARLKLSSEQLNLWGGDDDDKKSVESKTDNDEISEHREESEPVSSLSSAMAKHSIQSSKDDLTKENRASTVNQISKTEKKKSARYFPNCQASLVYLTSNFTDDPDFRPVTGPGRRAHMTLGVASGVSAVTTGYDLLEIVELESQEKTWPTYPGPRGWLRDYGEGRWVLYLNNKITFDSLFAGVYNFS